MHVTVYPCICLSKDKRARTFFYICNIGKTIMKEKKQKDNTTSMKGSRQNNIPIGSSGFPEKPLATIN